MKENSQLEIIEQNSNSLSHTQLEQSKASREREKKQSCCRVSLMADDLLGVCM